MWVCLTDNPGMDIKEPRILRLMDACSGLNGASDPAKASGRWDTFGIDSDPKLPADFTADILTVTADDIRDLTGWARPDVIWASPPCNGFSVASVGKHWNHPDEETYLPKSETAFLGMRILRHIQGLIRDLGPTFHVIENPWGIMPKVIGEPTVPIWQCHYGNTSAKPTMLAGNLPPSFVPRPECHNRPGSNRAPHAPDCCCMDHEGASRGAKSGTQGIGARDGFSAANWRAVIPAELSGAVTTAAETDLYRMLRAGLVA